MKNTNFFTPYIETKEKAGSSIRIAILGVFLLLTIFAAFFITNFTEIEKLQTEVAEKEAILNSQEFRENKKLIEETKRKIEIMSQYQAYVQAVSLQMEQVDIVSEELLSKIAATLPADVSFQVMSFDATQLQLMATSKSRVAIAQLQHNLLELEIFGFVHVANIAGGADLLEENYTFSLTAMFVD